MVRTADAAILAPRRVAFVGARAQQREAVHDAESRKQARAARSPERHAQQQRGIVRIIECTQQHHEQQQRERNAEARRQHVDAATVGAEVGSDPAGAGESGAGSLRSA